MKLDTAALDDYLERLGQRARIAVVFDGPSAGRKEVETAAASDRGMLVELANLAAERA
jgi:hypothetical protein